MPKKTNQAHKISFLVWNEHFCLKQGQALKASAAHLYPNFPWAPPPPDQMPLDYQLSTIKEFYEGPLLMI